MAASRRCERFRCRIVSMERARGKKKSLFFPPPLFSFTLSLSLSHVAASPRPQQFLARRRVLLGLEGARDPTESNQIESEKTLSLSRVFLIIFLSLSRTNSLASLSLSLSLSVSFSPSKPSACSCCSSRTLRRGRGAK